MNIIEMVIAGCIIISIYGFAKAIGILVAWKYEEWSWDNRRY